MTDKKLTDKEIVKAFNNLPVHSFVIAKSGEKDITIGDVADLINRQKADLAKKDKELLEELKYSAVYKTKVIDSEKEINRLQAENDNLKNDELPKCKDALRRANEIGIELQAENERLNEHYNIALQTVGEFKEENSRLLNFNEELAMKLDAKKIVADAEIVRNAKAEAYKECIEKVQKIFSLIKRECQNKLEDDGVFAIERARRKVDNLLKGLVGKNESKN